MWLLFVVVLAILAAALEMLEVLRVFCWFCCRRSLILELLWMFADYAPPLLLELWPCAAVFRLLPTLFTVPCRAFLPLVAILVDGGSCWTCWLVST